MIPSVYLFTSVRGINQQHNIKKLYFTDLFKLIVACTSWRIPEHRCNCIFDCRLLLGNLLFGYFDRFQAHNSSVCEKFESKILSEKEFRK